VSAAVEGVARPDEDVSRGAQIPKETMCPLGATIRGFVGPGHDDHDVVVAVAARIPACPRAKEIDALWLAAVDQAPDDLSQYRIEDLYLGRLIHGAISIHRSLRTPPVDSHRARLADG
jgi:hypothetical protein